MQYASMWTCCFALASITIFSGCSMRDGEDIPTTEYEALRHVRCKPTTCGAQNANCGTIADGCGGTLSCGVCSAGQTCGGGGTPNVCGSSAGTCTPTTCAAQGVACGTIRDGCGNALSCGGCTSGQSCNAGACVASYFVSGSAGNDAWSGMLASPNATGTDGPFKTLNRAKAAMATSAVKTTTIRSGTYLLAGINLTLDWQDSGQTWMPFQSETVVLDGGGTGYIDGQGAANITIEGLTIQNMGVGPTTGALHLSGSGHTIRWNTFLNCRQECIAGQISQSVIDSNTIDGSGGGGFSGAIALWYGASNNRISHNHISNSAAEAIDISDGQADPPMSNNLIDRNIVKRACTSTSDCGAIYLFDASHQAVGNRITNNVIDGNGGYGTTTTNTTDNWTKAIYLDDSVSNVIVSGNLCRGCGEYALQFHGGDHNTVVNNIFDLSAGGTLLGLYQRSFITADFGMSTNAVRNNIIYSSNGFPASLWQIGISAQDMLPADTTNLYYSATGASIPNTGIVDVNPVRTNPQFANPAAGDYSMPPTSAAYTLIQFQPLVTDQGPVPNPFQ